MLIICSGPDTWRARHKATAFARAFRQKHDPQGLSMDMLGRVDLSSLLNQLGSPSLFSSKRYLRCDDLLSSLKIAEIRALAARIRTDADQTIVVTVESEAPAQKLLAEFAPGTVFLYEHPLLRGAAYEAWCVEYGAELGVSRAHAREIAQLTQGDSWMAEQELTKRGAYADAPLAESADASSSAFDAAEAVFSARTGWREALSATDPEALVSVLLSQARTVLRVKDQEIQGIHPYAAKKLAGLRIQHPESVFLRVTRLFLASRQGLAQAQEAQTLL